MKILIITQKVNMHDDVLGFFHDWIREFAGQAEKVTVVCLEMGEFDLPDNVEVLSLGKSHFAPRASRDKGFKIFKRLKYIFLLNYYSWKNRKEYDRVFVHMIPEYVVAGACFWRLLGKRIGLWYAHGSVSLALRIAGVLVDDIFTSTRSGCKLATKKVHVVGQGIDVGRFSAQGGPARGWKVESKFFNIITVGRIAPIKGYETLIGAVEILVRERRANDIRVKIVGGTLLREHDEYFELLKKQVVEKGLERYIEFTGSVPFDKLLPLLQEADLFASTSRTGSLDKVMLEAMSCGVPVVACNEAVKEALGDDVDSFFYDAGDMKALSERMEYVYSLEKDKYSELSKEMRQEVVDNHGLESLVGKILEV